MGETMSVVVVGGAGAMGQITVRDLVETAPPELEIVVADHNLEAAGRLARTYRRRGVRAVGVDVTKLKPTVQALKGAFAVINCTQHAFNLPVMQACLRAGTHYCDLGGLFHVTRQQLELDRDFQRNDRLALLGIGAAPGVVNVLARSAADRMDEVHEIHCLVGNVDRTPDRPSTPLGTSYSLRTIVEEASLPAALFTGGRFTFVEPMSGAEPEDFPLPVGTVHPARTLHSEVATLPLSYRDKGVQEVSFRIAFSAELDDRLRFLNAIGMLSAEPVAVGRVKVAPRDVLLRVAAALPRPTFAGVPDEYEVVRAIVRGVRRGRGVEEVVDCHTPGIPAWGFGVDVDTGCPPSIAMQLLARGEITARGTVPPERAVPAEPFFAELLRRGMIVRRSERPYDPPARTAPGAAASGAERGPGAGGRTRRRARSRPGR